MIKWKVQNELRVVLLAREDRANYYIIKPYLQQKTFLILTQLCGETAL
jgi:hypothetical protein